MGKSDWKSIARMNIGKGRRALRIVLLVIGVGALGDSLASSLDMISRSSSYSREFRAILEAQTGDGIVLKYGDFSDYRDIMNRVEQIEGVESSSPFILEETLIFSDCCQQSVLLQGIIPNESERTLEIERYIAEGKLGTLSKSEDENSQKYPGMAIGETLAKNLQVRVGSLVRLPGRTAGKSGAQTAGSEESKAFRVRAILEFHYEGYDDVIAYISLADAQELLGMGDSIVGLHIDVANPEDQQVYKDVSQGLGGRFVVEKWRSMNAQVLDALDLQQSVFLWSRIPLCLAGLLCFVCCILLITLMYSGSISGHLASGGDKGTVRKGLIREFVPWVLIGAVAGFTLSFGLTVVTSAPIPQSADIDMANVPVTFETAICSVFSILFLVLSTAVVIGIAYFTAAVIPSRTVSSGSD